MAEEGRKKQIKIACKGSRTETLSKLEVIQGKLKDLSPANLAKLRKRIESKGFDAPFFVWQNKILDGTQRKKVLEAMLADGWTLRGGKVPVCDIEAENLDQAKDRLLGYVSQYGKVTHTGFDEFLSGIEFPDISTLELPGGIGEELEVSHKESQKLTYTELKLRPYNKTHILLSFAPELLVQIQPHLKNILAIEGVEHEQGSN